jgi:hypothetical protein
MACEILSWIAKISVISRSYRSDQSAAHSLPEVVPATYSSPLSPLYCVSQIRVYQRPMPPVFSAKETLLRVFPRLERLDRTVEDFPTPTPDPLCESHRRKSRARFDLWSGIVAFRRQGDARLSRHWQTRRQEVFANAN